MGKSTKLSVAVLAGGRSSRMGTDKALIEVEGELLVSRVAKGLRAISNDVFVVSKRPLDATIAFPEHLDELEDQTPLAGIITALYNAVHPVVFVCGCDMPFISNDVVLQLAGTIGDANAVAPRHDDVVQPLHAVWSKAALPELEELYADGQRAVHRALETLRARVVDIEDGRSFVNINTRSDLEAIQPPTKREASSWKLSGN
jgi:molybdopterin-guanine dinucleotide biosynthesis protein A